MALVAVALVAVALVAVALIAVALVAVALVAVALVALGGKCWQDWGKVLVAKTYRWVVWGNADEN